jgi:SWI/SNF-related matrix-associated actin-dependent regulator 1 of chromatin subfamily A
MYKVVTYHGTQDYRAELRYDLKKDLGAGNVDVMLSTFNIFERDSSRDDRNFLYKMKFEYLIIDEAHILKVNTSARFINLNLVCANHRLLLSGTPVQNNLSELLSLMSFLMPRVFAKIDINDLLEGFGWDKKGVMPSISSGSISITGLRAMLAPFILRRVKSDVLNQLVDKESFVEMIQMTRFQRAVYDNILYSHARKKESVKLYGESKVVDESILTAKHEHEEQGIEHTASNLCASEAAHLFTALRKAANHPLLLRVRYHEEEVMTLIAEVALAKGRFGHQCNYQRVRDEIETFSDFSLHQLCLEYPESLGHLQLEANSLYSSQKMQKLKEMLPRLVVGLSLSKKLQLMYFLLFFVVTLIISNLLFAGGGATYIIIQPVDSSFGSTRSITT